MRVAQRSGSLLVITLWLVTILTVLVVAIARYLSLEIRITKHRLAHEQARWLARSGVYLAMQRLARDVEPDGHAYDWLQDDWAQAPQASGDLEITIADLERALDVNAADAATLTRLIGSADVANAIVDYADEDHNGPLEAPDEERAYVPKNGLVTTLEELRDVPGQTEEIFERLQRFTFAVPEPGPTPLVNVNTAGREVLLAVVAQSSLDEAAQTLLVNKLEAFREQGHYVTNLAPQVEADSEAALAQFDGTELQTIQTHFSAASQLFTIHATGRVDRPPVQYRVRAVVKRSAPGERPAILSWSEGARRSP